ncbi:MAG TPA: cell wall hydrolase [Allosphingosinicella sp.]|nr:cell wall hydrolase [Allosphingosinicella sp.]
MALGVRTSKRTGAGTRLAAPAWAWLALLVPMASCVPAAAVQSPALAIAAAPQAPAPIGSAAAAMPLAGTPPLAADGFVFRASTQLDQLRSLDCLAQAIYYEAASESEEGQRAVAQVVLNRVRHPAWPNSVCGVVYQGPMRAGGGCQFTFTCDGSLARPPGGIPWVRARTIAAEALAGRSFAGVGLSTHYHTNYVFPSWAPRLTRTAMIGAHLFYGLPGTPGLPGAFTAHYAGSEPVPRSAGYFPFRQAVAADFSGLAPATAADIRAAVTMPSDIPQNARWAATNLPESTVRDEYSRSGQWRDDAPASVTGR